MRGRWPDVKGKLIIVISQPGQSLSTEGCLELLGLLELESWRAGGGGSGGKYTCLLHTSIFSGFSDKCLQILISWLVELDTLDQEMSYRVSYKAVACTTYLTGFNSQSSIF
ncbi:unnamed protein product [Nezara viridula]|uniref:Uncharacterized protein n=1 Tax=Nezara viridula TaxID=85310 RepID=A0A9P0HSG7_NEZVI|nr:unnamed protein product [Nezara viridula]